MKKILGLTVAAMLVMGLVGGGTWAYFSDSEYSTGNLITAGTMDLTLDGTDSNVVMVNVSLNDALPGDRGSPYVTLLAAGTLTGELDIAVGTVTDTADSNTLETENGLANLGDSATMILWLDTNNNGTWESGDIELEPGGAVTYDTDSVLGGGTRTINSFSGVTWDAVDSAFSGPARFYMDWDIDTSIGNEIQGDSVGWGFTFTLEQTDAI